MEDCVLDLMNNIRIEDIFRDFSEDLKCPECNSTETVTVKGELICKECGLVLSGPCEYVGGKKINLPYGLNFSIE